MGVLLYPLPDSESVDAPSPTLGWNPHLPTRVVMGPPAVSHLYRGVYLFALPTDQRKPEILQLDVFVGPGERGAEEASPRHQNPSPLEATPLTQTPKKGHIPQQPVWPSLQFPPCCR